MSTQIDMYPLVPLEVEREIFELTVRECPGTGPRLCLVARRVNTWYALESSYMRTTRFANLYDIGSDPCYTPS